MTDELKPHTYVRDPLQPGMCYACTRGANDPIHHSTAVVDSTT